MPRRFLPKKGKYYTGVEADPRSAEQRKTDYLHEERLLSLSGDPFGNHQIKTMPYPDDDQLGVGSCVPHGVGAALAVAAMAARKAYIRLSWTAAYRLRSNYPEIGCWLQDIFDKYRKPGAPLYTTLPDPQTEAQAAAAVVTDQMKLEAEIFEGLEYYIITIPNNIVTLAGLAQQGKAVPIIFYSTYDEWAQEYPTIKDPKLAAPGAEVRHCVMVLPNSGFTKGGKRYVSIKDSAHFGDRTLRHISEDFITARVYGAGYWDSVNIIGSGDKPKHTFTKTLAFGARGEEVTWLQKLLISEGLLPSDCATGLFAGRTLAGLHAFQNKYADKILVPIGLDAPTDTFGSMSIAQANRITA